ncbi:hypothetical protein AAD018_012730 [Aestuariibius insulae]|uniref:hypothetical protein n=1 Tax=Aestuariibius insulae TaxID=2058287 RepID=UPI00398F3FB3
MEDGRAWRRHVWTRARADLLPKLPLEVVRVRVRRAKELGLPYKTYAGVRASTGRDVIGFLFSSNALRLLRAGDVLPASRAAKLVALTGCDKLAVVQPGFPLGEVPIPPLDDRIAAPLFTHSWPGMRVTLAAPLRARGLPADGVLVIGETAIERDWAEAARTAGFIQADRFF